MNSRGRYAGGVVLAVGAGTLLLGAFGDPSGAQSDPGGANGTIKIDGVEFDQHPDNEPKPGCTFEVDFYGFDADDLYAEVVFSGQGATGSGTIESGRVDLDRDANDGGGSEDGFDGGATFDLTAELTAAGSAFSLGEDGRYHVRVDITVFQDDGVGGVEEEASKTKVFKLPACGQAPPPPPPPPPPGDGIPSGGGTPPAVLGTSTPAPAASSASAAASGAQVSGVTLARTGASANTLIALVGLGALVAGLVLVRCASAMRGAMRATG